MPVQETKMERTSISLPEPQKKSMEARVKIGEFSSFNEGVRAAVREYNERHPLNPSSVASSEGSAS